MNLRKELKKAAKIAAKKATEEQIALIEKHGGMEKFIKSVKATIKRAKLLTKNK